MKILHCADIHLDSPFSGLTPAEGDARRDELRKSFASAIEYAKRQDVDLILIAGDVFDRPFCTVGTKAEVFRILAEAGRPVVISPGNHDHYMKGVAYTDRALPENVFVFSSTELGRFDFDELGVSVFGYAFTSGSYEDDPLANGVPLSESNINILCAHTDIHPGATRYASMSPSAIAHAGFTYAALGHIHRPQAPQTIGTCTVAYSGSLQGRSFDETGEGGAYIVDIDEQTRKVSLERVIFSKLHYEVERLDITGCERDSEVASRIAQTASARGWDENTALRVVLEGAIPSSYIPSQKKICADSSIPTLALLEIKDDTSPMLDLAHLERDTTIRGELYRSLLPQLTGNDPAERECARLALRAGLAALDKRELSLGLSSDLD